MDFAEQVTDATVRRAYTVRLFLDLEKAFDTIDHKTLVLKLEMYGTRGLAHNWLSRYLES